MSRSNWRFGMGCFGKSELINYIVKEYEEYYEYTNFENCWTEGTCGGFICPALSLFLIITHK